MLDPIPQNLRAGPVLTTDAIVDRRVRDGAIPAEIDAETAAIPLAKIRSRTNIIRIGEDALEFESAGLDDLELLKAFGKTFKHGVNVGTVDDSAGPVWIHGKALLGLASPDGFGLELTGLSGAACQLIRLACDPERAEALGVPAITRLIKIFESHATNLARAKRPNQIHGVRFGIGAKVVPSDLLEPGNVEIHPDGNVARALARAVGVEPYELEGWHALVLRHPVIMSYVARIGFNDRLTYNLILANRAEFRRVNLGDFDGDGANLFPIRDEAMAIQLAKELEEIVPGMDLLLAIRGIAAEDPEAEKWGEITSKTTDEKLAMRFEKTVDTWLDTHAEMGACFNTYTPYAYRISDVCSAMATTGHAGARIAGLIGAVVEEEFYLSGSGGPDGLDQALAAWFGRKMNAAGQQVLFGGLRNAVDPAILDQDTRDALARGSMINRGRFDPRDPMDAVAYAAWTIGKGLTSSMDNLPLLEALDEIAMEPETAELRDNFVAKLAFRVARRLVGVIGTKPERQDPDDDPWEENAESEIEISRILED